MRKTISDIPIDELRAMPLDVLRNKLTDIIGGISSPEEEQILQSIVSEKMLSGNMNVNLDFRIGINTDVLGVDAIQSPEDEAKAQAIIDQRVAAFKARMQSQALQMAPQAQIAPPVIETTPEVVSTPEVKNESEVKVEETSHLSSETKARCQYCPTKGMRHYKSCTRPK